MSRIARRTAPQDPVEQATERAFHVNAILLHLLQSWKEAPGEQDMRDRVQALGPVGHTLKVAVADVEDVDGLAETRGAITDFVTAIQGIYHDHEALQGMDVLRWRLRDLLAATYVLEQVVERAEANRDLLSRRPE
jgi:hypothetical protein